MTTEVADVQTPKNDSPEPRKEGTYLFGRRIEDIPCFRESFLRGIGGGLILGITHFMFTSKVKRSTDVGVFSVVGISFAQWFYCRYMHSVRKMNAQKLERLIEMRKAYEGTAKDPSNAEQK